MRAAPLIQRFLVRRGPSLAFGLTFLSSATDALADRLTIKQPGLHPDYSFEAEPHLLAEPFNDPAVGAGFRGTVELVDNGFVRPINNTVGIGFGADITNKGVAIPVVMQWNFWLSQNWSVFGEPGGIVRFKKQGKNAADFLSFYAGGRWHFARDMALTMRVGHPSFSIGVSFLL